MRLHTATVWWDLMDDESVLFVHPDAEKLESIIWTEFNTKYNVDFEPYPGEIEMAFDDAGGRVVFDTLDVPGFVIVPVEMANEVLSELKQWRDDEIQNITEMGRDKPDIYGHDDGEWGKWRKVALPKLVTDFETIAKEGAKN